MRRIPKDNPNKEIADAIRLRLEELGITQTKFLNSNAIKSINRPTFAKVVRGEGSTQYRTIKAYLEALGLEIRIVPVKDVDTTLDELGLTDPAEPITYR